MAFRILVVEDDPATRQGVAALLSGAGYDVVQASSMAEALDACDRLAAAEQRARNHVREQQPLLAGEVIFSESRDLLDAMRIQIARSRDQINAAANRIQIDVRREQMLLLGGGAGVLVLVMLLLVPTGRPAPVPTPEPSPEETAPRSIAPWARPAPTPEVRFDADALAVICRDLAAVAESDQIAPILDRTRALLGARGVIVWMSTPDRSELHAAAASGYDERVVARIGSIANDASNLTADAFRDNMVRTSGPAGDTPAAVAVPLPAPGGPAGVFSAELTPGSQMDETKLSAARIVAAQLGSVLGAANAKLPDAADAAPSAEAAQPSS